MVINLAPKCVIVVDTERFKEKIQNKLYLANVKSKKGSVTMLMPDKVDLKTKSITWGPLEHVMTIKVILSGGHNSHKCICLNYRASKYRKQKLTELKGEQRTCNQNSRLNTRLWSWKNKTKETSKDTEDFDSTNLVLHSLWRNSQSFQENVKCSPK